MNIQKNKPFILFIVLGMFCFFVSQTQAMDRPLMGIGIGAGCILDDDKIMLGSVEYRPAVTIYKLNPWFLIDFGDDVFFGAIGLMMKFNLTQSLLLTPSFGVGYCSEKNGIDLGSTLQFRSAIELTHEFQHNGQLGVSFGHVSNGGLSDKNPGFEFLKISYFFPID